jgi:DnaJ-class molecular chaperone
MEDISYICDQCKGEGSKQITKPPENDPEYIIYYRVCNKCNGSGTLNWIQNIFCFNSNSYRIESKRESRRMYTKKNP